jgi:integral membrane sensor domain MASE1
VVWPPTGISLAAYLLLGYRIWPGILSGAFLVNLTTAGTAVTSAGIAAGNMLEGLLGAYLVNRFAAGVDVFQRGQDILKFTVLAGVVATTVSATFGVTSLTQGGFAARGDYVSIWLTWWLGDMLGTLIFAPPIVLWGINRAWPWNRRQTFEAIALIVLLVALGQALFGGWLLLKVKDYALVFLVAPVLIWMAFRFRQREVATANLMLCVLAIRGTLQGYGPFVMPSPGESILLLQTFMGVTALMSLTVAAIFSELRRVFGELEDALSDVKTLKGLVPICAWCKKIRNAEGDWEELEAYFEKRTGVDFTHGICPGCLANSKAGN